MVIASGSGVWYTHRKRSLILYCILHNVTIVCTTSPAIGSKSEDDPMPQNDSDIFKQRVDDDTISRAVHKNHSTTSDQPSLSLPITRLCSTPTVRANSEIPSAGNVHRTNQPLAITIQDNYAKTSCSSRTNRSDQVNRTRPISRAVHN